MPETREKNNDHCGREMIRQIGLLLGCAMYTLFLCNCGVICVIGDELIASDSCTAKLTKCRKSLQSDTHTLSEDNLTSDGTMSEQSTPNSTPWNTTLGVLSSAGYSVTVPADITKAIIFIPYYAAHASGWEIESDHHTARFTEYRRSFKPLKTKHTESTCDFQGTTKLDSQEYLRYDTQDFANWEKNSKGMTYLLPTQGNGPAFIHETNSLTSNKSDKYAEIVFDLDGTTPKKALKTRQEKNRQFYLETLRKGDNKYKPDSILYVDATRTGEGTQIHLFKKNGPEWEVSGPYVVEQQVKIKQPIHDCWLDTLRLLSSVGYIVTVTEDTADLALSTVELGYITILLCILPQVAG